MYFNSQTALGLTPLLTDTESLKKQRADSANNVTSTIESLKNKEALYVFSSGNLWSPVFPAYTLYFILYTLWLISLRLEELFTAHTFLTTEKENTSDKHKAI